MCWLFKIIPQIISANNYPSLSVQLWHFETEKLGGGGWGGRGRLKVESKPACTRPQEQYTWQKDSPPKHHLYWLPYINSGPDPALAFLFITTVNWSPMGIHISICKRETSVKFSRDLTSLAVVKIILLSLHIITVSFGPTAVFFRNDRSCENWDIYSSCQVC